MKLRPHLVAILLLATSARPAGADEAADRRALLMDAQAARKSGDHASALALAQRAAEIRTSSSLLRFIAEENLALDDPVSAFQTANECIHFAERERPSPNREAVLEGCRFLVKTMRGRVGLVRVIVEGGGTDARVTINAVERDPSRSWAVAPGTVAIEASAPGHETARDRRDVEPGGELEVTLALRPEVEAPPDPASTVPPSQSRARAPDRPTLDRAGSVADGAPSRLLGTTLAIGGGVLALGAGVTYLVSNGRFNDLREECADGRCPSDAQDEKSRIETLDTVALVGAITGVALVGGGVTLLVLNGGSQESARTPTVAARVGPGVVSLEGSFE